MRLPLPCPLSHECHDGVKSLGALPTSRPDRRADGVRTGRAGGSGSRCLSQADLDESTGPHRDELAETPQQRGSGGALRTSGPTLPVGGGEACSRGVMGGARY
jgi:hypothetical protein